MMTRRELILAALAPATGAAHTPVQVQKLFFLIDREIAQLVDGPHFEFRPYHYGPFDSGVYQELEALGAQGFVGIQGCGSWRTFALSPKGQADGDRLLGTLEPRAADFIRRASAFVREHNFASLVSAIYKAYPEMRQNSVFREE